MSSNLPSVIDRSNLSPSREASRWGDKYDRSMTRGKLLDNDTQLFIFISILIMTQLHPRDPENRHWTEPILGTALLEKKKKQLQSVEWETGHYRWIMPSSCHLPFKIGEKNQVILKLIILLITWLYNPTKAAAKCFRQVLVK